jgi:hypothetical protein
MRTSTFSIRQAAGEDADAIARPAGNHHTICYAATLDYQVSDWKNVPAVDQECAACILGPNS